jgi:hypothetical protein
MSHKHTYESSAAEISIQGSSWFHVKLLTLSLCSLSTIVVFFFKSKTLTILSNEPVARTFSKCGLHSNESTLYEDVVKVFSMAPDSEFTSRIAPLKSPTASWYVRFGLYAKHLIES